MDTQFYKGEISHYGEDATSWRLFIFFPAAFTYVCPTEMGAIAEWYERFKALGCDLLACSSDSSGDHKKWFETYDELYGKDVAPVVSSTGIPKQYGVWDESKQLCKRASVFVSPTGEYYSRVHFDTVGRSFKELYREFAGMRTGKYCGVDYDPNKVPVVKVVNGVEVYV